MGGVVWLTGEEGSCPIGTPRRGYHTGHPAPGAGGIVAGALAAGCENAPVPWRELRADGSPGTAKRVHRWFAQHRTAPAPSTPHKWRDGAPAVPPTPRPAACPRRGSSLGRSSGPRRRCPRPRWPWRPGSSETAGTAALARRFAALARGCGAGRNADPKAALADLGTWLADARASGMRAMGAFAAGLGLDGAAIRAALTAPWSSGQAEGRITRLKLIERQS